MNEKKQLPNIILLVLDTQRADRLSTYGYHRETSPNIDDFGRHATVFENGVSPAQWTVPAHVSIFTGEYPGTHQITQGRDRLDSGFDTISALLAANGYQTVGFCNNPLVGVLNNGFKRGFKTFFNYSGLNPSVPQGSNRMPKLLNRVWKAYSRRLRRIAHPLQDAAARSDFLLRLSINPLVSPQWIRLAKIKGDTAKSLANVKDYLEQVYQDRTTSPQFVFINLMETHVPYTAPSTFLSRFAPYFKEERQARDFMHNFNSQILHWLLPLEEGLDEMESLVLNDMYDAEVNYQDYLLADLLEFLTREEVADNTLTIIVADHGEGLGEHGFIGHCFVAYQELVHVPLIIKLPKGVAAGKRISSTVSTRRIFHTVLEAANVQLAETAFRPSGDVNELSLTRTIQGGDPEHEIVFTEAYVRDSLLSVMETRVPHLIEKFHCRFNRRAVFQRQWKLVRIDSIQDELFDLTADSAEVNDISDQYPDQASDLARKLEDFMARRLDNGQILQALNFEDDENLMKRLRALGYYE